MEPHVKVKNTEEAREVVSTLVSKYRDFCQAYCSYLESLMPNSISEGLPEPEVRKRLSRYGHSIWRQHMGEIKLPDGSTVKLPEPPSPENLSVVFDIDGQIGVLYLLPHIRPELLKGEYVRNIRTLGLTKRIGVYPETL